MKRLLFHILFLLLFQTVLFGQRNGRRLQPSITAAYQPKTFEGRLFPVTLSSNDTVLVFLKLGFSKPIENGDTLNLARTYNCNNPESGGYYDLHDLVEQENNCLRWYNLQPIKPGDTLRFFVRLKDFDETATSKLYYCYTKEIKSIDKELKLYSDPKLIYLTHEPRNFESRRVILGRDLRDYTINIGWQAE